MKSDALRSDRADATAMEILEARVQAQDEAIQHLKDCVTDALRLCAVVPGAPVRPEDALDEDWSK